MHDRKYSGSLVVACAGPEEAPMVATVFGEMRCRAGASLKFTTEDAKLVFSKWSTDSILSQDAHILLINPSFSEFESAIECISKELNDFPQEETGIDLFFAGHGLSNSGAIVLKDRELLASNYISLIKENMTSDPGSRGISIMLDSCYSSAFLFDALVTLQDHSEAVRLYDALCSSMHDEKSWELSFLEHGAFTYTQFHKGNTHIDPIIFGRAIDEQDQKTIAKCIQGLVGMMGDPVAFLTQGKQHTLDCIKGVFINSNTRGSVDIRDLNEPFDVEMIINVLRRNI